MTKLPLKFQASGITCGIKDSGRPDLALVYSETDCKAAGVLTQNRVVGAPVVVCRERLPAENLRGIIVNSGNANACTGEHGLADARSMTSKTAEAFDLQPEQFAVMSTGIIGVPLPMEKILLGIPKAASELKTGSEATIAAATAMMTTDTFAKHVVEEIVLSQGTVCVTGIAKGAAMIAPNMATMLGIVMTDATLTTQQASDDLKTAVDRSFNCISVDGHMSTSDTVVLMANSASGVSLETDSDRDAFLAGLQRICEKLATDIIKDGEGAEHFVTVDVEGFEFRRQAFVVAKEIAESALVKTAITGNDPNWGRITSAAGYAGVAFDAKQLSLTINESLVYQHGQPTDYDEGALSKQMAANKDIHLKLWLSGGPCSGDQAVRFWTTDLTQEYVRLNSEYTT